MIKWVISFLLLFQLEACFVSHPAALSRKDEWAQPMAVKPENFYKVDDSVYRSAQVRGDDYPIISKLAIRSVLNLRQAYEDHAPEGITGIKFYHVRMRAAAISDEEMIAALKIIKTAPKPILVHCKLGADRTGAVVALYRVLFGGWTKEAAIEELLNGGYHFHTRYDNIPAYIQQADIEKLRKAISA